jgi:hypothetical protein
MAVMLVVKVELWSAISGEYTEIARMTIVNNGLSDNPKSCGLASLPDRIVNTNRSAGRECCMHSRSYVLLNDVAERAIALNTKVGVTNTHKADTFVRLVAADGNLQEEAAPVAGRKFIHDRATQQMRPAQASDTRQASFFSLHTGYAIESERGYKDTELLTRLQSQALLRLREKQGSPREHERDRRTVVAGLRQISQKAVWRDQDYQSG